MNNDQSKVREVLASLNPASLAYEEWLRVGMVCKDVGVSFSEFNAWSKARCCRPGVNRANVEITEAKWASFRGNGRLVGIGSLIAMADAYGVPRPASDPGHFGWDESVPITSPRSVAKDAAPEPEARALVDERWVEPEDIPAPAQDWAQNDIHRYLEAMFEPDDRVGLVFGAWQGEDGRWLPQKGVADRTRMELQQAIRSEGLENACGDVHPAAGAWVRINPLNGEGFKDANVTAFRHSLIEADDQDLGKQLALIRKMQLPCAAIVHSGGKSIHALVRIDAGSAEEYRDRVDRLYKVCEASGLKVDRGCRNPSRLSRLPGVFRGERPQYLIDTRCGLGSWAEWEAYIEDVHDDLPDPEPLSQVWTCLPPLARPLIDGILREGHKARLTGPSKAGKSFALIEMACAIAEGKDWLGMPCRQGPVLYINLELDRASCLHRFHEVYTAAGWKPDTISAIDTWNLRGHAVPLDKLAPKLIRRAIGKGYVAVIVDPIYKLQWGDENDAGDVARFCNQLDRICHELGAAVIDAHHHSKGTQGQKRSIDRGSGSGVFGRDPDAILDMIELDISKDRRDQVRNKAVEAALMAFGARNGLDMGRIEPDARAPAAAFLMAFQMEFPPFAQDAANCAFMANQVACDMSGWRIEATLREFRTPEPRKVWFRYPIHMPDVWDLLTDAKAAGEEPPWEAARKSKDNARRNKADAAREEMDAAIEAAGGTGKARVCDVADEIGVTIKTVRNRVESGMKRDGYYIEEGVIYRREGKGN